MDCYDISDMCMSYEVIYFADGQKIIEMKLSFLEKRIPSGAVVMFEGEQWNLKIDKVNWNYHEFGTAEVTLSQSPKPVTAKPERPQRKKSCTGCGATDYIVKDNADVCEYCGREYEREMPKEYRYNEKDDIVGTQYLSHDLISLDIDNPKVRKVVKKIF